MPTIPREPIENQPSEIPAIVPLLVNPQFILFPYMIAPLLIQDEKVVRMIDDVVAGSRAIGVFAPRPAPPEPQGPPPADAASPDAEASKPPDKNFFDKIYDIGTVALVLRMLKMPDGSLRLLIHGVKRARLAEPMGEDPYPKARIETLEDIVVDDDETKALKNNVRLLLAKLVEHSGSMPDELPNAAHNTDDPGRLADLICSNLNVSIHQQQEVLRLTDAKQRLRLLQEIMSRELDIAKLGSKIQSEVKSNIDQMQRNYFLREQMKAIRRELGEESDAPEEMDDLAQQIAKAQLPEHAEKVANKELARLRQMSPQSAEYTVSRTYLDWIVNLPWNNQTEDSIDLAAAQRILDEDHYDLEKIKERILEYLAVIKLRREIRGPLLCLVGPPGVGKTSLGRSVARAMGRKFIRVSLGGVRDEAEIRGHRRTYIGALPGRVIKSLKDAGSRNPVFMLDEVDKLGADFRGDPASALLEVLDPEQNSTFTDHYLDLAFDLSRVMFITTANTLETIPGPLLDRMEVLRLAGYTLQEKVKIAEQYLVPRAIENNGLKPSRVVFKRDALERIIEGYTREAGLRNLEREISNLCRKIARRVAEGRRAKVTVNTRFVADSLGPERFDRDLVADRLAVPGVAIGLAWTPAGGDILFIEANAHDGKGHLTLTGQLGEVMKESAQAARTFLHAQAAELGVDSAAFKDKDLHIHVPAGAIPKDGPSAGVAMLVAMASLFLGRPVRPALAMTGEITLKGTVLPVGGIKEKLLAAHRAGITAIILPARNKKDLMDVPDDVRSALTFHFVDRAADVMKIAFADAAEIKPARNKPPRGRAPKKKSAAPKKKTRPANHALAAAERGLAKSKH